MHSTAKFYSLRKRLVAIGLGLSLLAAAVASFPILTADDANEVHSSIYENAIAGPQVGSGDGGGG